MNKSIFLDRDGVINFDKNYVHKVEDFEFIPGSIDAMKSLQEAGYKLFIITNQSGIGRGFYTEEDMLKLHDYMLEELEKYSIKIECIYYCPHGPADGCLCRKPNPTFILEAEKKFDIDLGASYFVGDRDTDIGAGKNAGIKTILVGDTETEPCEPDYREDNLFSATKNIILNDGKN